MSTEALPSIEQVISSMKSEAAPAAPAAADIPAEVAKSEPEAANAESSPAQPVEAAAEETPAAEEKKPEQPRDPVSKKFAALSRQEKELRARKQEQDRRQAEVDARLKQLEEREAKAADYKKSPYKLLKEHGLTVQDIINDSVGAHVYEEPVVDPIQARLDKIEKENQELKAKLEAGEQRTTEKEYNQAIQEVNETFKQTVAEGGEAYELMAQFGDEAIELGKDIMRECWHEHQQLLDYSEVCAIVEKHYEDEILNRLVSTKKAASRLSAQNSGSKTPPPKQVPSKEAKSPNTLTNSTSTVAQAKIDVDKLEKEDALSLLAKQLKYR
jgi:hypothetical protein